MQRFRNVFVLADPGDPRNALFERAVRLALRNRALLTVASIVEPLPETDARMAAKRSADLCGIEVQETVAQEDCRRLEALVTPLRDAGVEVQTRILRGTPCLEIIREVLRYRHDLVMMPADGKSERTFAAFGSTCINLMRKCPCPVWVIKPGHSGFYARILAAVDLRPSDRERNALNIKIIELAASLARDEQSELYIVHAWNPSRMFSFGSLLSRGAKERMVSAIQREREAWLDELPQQCSLDNLRYQVHLLEGEAGEFIPAMAKFIPAMAKRKRIDVIVMGMVCRTGVAGLFIGNTAEKVLRQVGCSVLTVKPDAFMAPAKIDHMESTHAA
jgi:universal stress protein E